MKIKLAVLFGGKSVEHEISVISAIQAINYLNRDKYDVIPIYITKNNEMYIGDEIGKIESYRDIPSLLSKSTKINLVNDGKTVNIIRCKHKAFSNDILGSVDVAFPIVHGTNVEDGSIQGYLTILNLPYVGCDVMSSAVGMDKYVMKTVLKDNNIPVLDCKCFTSADASDMDAIISAVEEKFSYPVIVKPINLGSSVGISKADNTEALHDALDTAFTYAQKILVEPAVVNLKEINCSVVGDYESAEASECEEPTNSDEILTYENKYTQGASKGQSKGMASLARKIPADISDDMRDLIRKTAVDAFRVLGCSGISRIDFMIDTKENKLYLNEINTIPGSLSFYLWEPIGVKYRDLLDRIIDLALKRDREQSAITYSFDTNVLEGITFGGAKGSKGSKL